MKIKKLSATFGKLKNDSLSFAPGLNIVRAPNESGKSTWCAFIRAMLYGINTSERDKIGHLSDKTRYRPWSGDGMSGTMDLDYDGRDITLERTSLGSVPMKKFRAVYTGTGEEIDGLTGENAGETLTGVTESVFERTAFIRQAGIRIDQANELEKRISSIVSAGDEQQSYSETDTALRAWQRKLKYNKSGLLPQLEEELRNAEDQYSRLEAAAEGMSQMRQEIDRLKERKAQLEEDLVTIDKLKAKAEAKAVWDAKKRAEDRKAELDKIKAALTVNGKMLTRGDTAALREACASLPPLEDVRNKAEKAYGNAQIESEKAENAIRATSFAGKSVSELRDKIRTATEFKNRAEEAEKKTMSKKQMAIIICGLLLAYIAIAVVSFLLNKIWIGGVAIVVYIVLIAFMVKKGKKTDDSGERLELLLGSLGCRSIAELEEKTEIYAELCDDADSARINLEGTRQSFDSAEKALDSAKALALEKVSLIMPGVTDASMAAQRIGMVDELIDRCAKAEFEAVSAQNEFEALLTRCGGEMPELDETFTTAPIRNLDDTKAYLVRVGEQLESANEKYNLAMGQLRAMGDPVVVGGRIRELKDQIKENTEKYNSLQLAVSALSAANTELSTRFSPIISEKAGEIMGRLTGGKYESLVFDKSFDAQAKESGEPATRNALALSAGAKDQLYLALRLSMCDIVLPEENKCPIILDDALVNLDDERTALALEELRRIAKDRQVILFTCHSREGEMAADFENVKVISVDKF